MLIFRPSDAYTPPFYATKMTGFGVDYTTPRPPFILAKLIWRNGLSIVISPMWFVLQVIVRFIAGVFGFSAGVFGHASDRREAVADANTANWIFRAGVVEDGPVLGMGADEIL